MYEAFATNRYGALRFLPGQPSGRITSLISFFNSRTLKNKRVAFGAARAFDQSAGIVTRNTNSWSGNECFNNANSPSVSLHPSFPFPLPRRSPSSFRPPRPPRPRSPGTALKIYFHRRTDVTSLSRGSDACIDRQMSLAHLSPASPPCRGRTLSLQSAVNCFQLNCLPFSRHPFAAQRRLFAPLNAARAFETRRIFDACRRPKEKGDPAKEPSPHFHDDSRLDIDDVHF